MAAERPLTICWQSGPRPRVFLLRNLIFAVNWTGSSNINMHLYAVLHGPDSMHSFKYAVHWNALLFQLGNSEEQRFSLGSFDDSRSAPCQPSHTQQDKIRTLTEALQAAPQAPALSEGFRTSRLFHGHRPTLRSGWLAGGVSWLGQLRPSKGQTLRIAGTPGCPELRPCSPLSACSVQICKVERLQPPNCGHRHVVGRGAGEKKGPVLGGLSAEPRAAGKI